MTIEQTHDESHERQIRQTLIPFARLMAVVALWPPALMLAASVAPQAQSATQSEVLPGYWEYTTSVVSRDTEQKCVRPLGGSIGCFGSLSTRKWRCTYPTRQGRRRRALKAAVGIARAAASMCG